MIVENVVGRKEFLVGIRGDIQRKRTVNGEHTLSFEIVKDEKNAHAFDLLEGRGFIHLEGETYRIRPFDLINIGSSALKRIDAIHTFYDLKETYVYESLKGTLNIDRACNHIFQNTTYQVFVSGAFPTVEFENFGDDNVISLLQTVVKRFGAEFDVRGMNVYITNRIGVETDFQFRYRYNIKTVSINEDWGDFATYIEGFGKDGLHSTYTSPLAQKYGIIHQKPVRDDRYTTIEGLNERLVSDLNDLPKLTIKINSGQIEGMENVELGDFCWCIHEPLELDIQVRVLSITDYPNSKKMPTFEFANVSAQSLNRSISMYYAPNNQQTTTTLLYDSKSAINKVVTPDGKVNSNALENGVQQVVGGIGSAFTQLDFDDKFGIVARDPGNFMRFVCFKKTGVYVSEDNGFTMKEVINPTGLNLGSLDVATLTYVNSELAKKSDVTHNHDALYAVKNHNHDTSYAAKTHNHDLLYAPITHNHDNTYVKKVGSDDIEINDGLKGVIFKDKITNKRMRLTVENGLPVLAEVTTT